MPLARPRLRNSVWEIPVHHMRGGTSTGLVIWKPAAPIDQELREELLRHFMGVPLEGEWKGNKQITGLGRGSATSNKVFFAELEDHPDGPRLVSTLAQMASDHGRIDWSVNCGNMSSALQLWALDTGLIVDRHVGSNTIDILNTNTGVLTTSRMVIGADGAFALSEIPGVMGRHPSVDLFLHHPAGAKTGALLPTGNAIDVFDGVRTSCVDVAVPMVIIPAVEVGKTSHESTQELGADLDLMRRLRKIWVEAGLRMQLRRKDGQPMTADQLALSETIPKVCIIGQPSKGGDLAVRYFTPQSIHSSLVVSGGCCLAAATLVPGSVAHELAPKKASQYLDEISVDIENPAGMLSTTVVASFNDGLLAIEFAAYQRSTQVLLSGYSPLYNASDKLSNFFRESAVP